MLRICNERLVKQWASYMWKGAAPYTYLFTEIHQFCCFCPSVSLTAYFCRIIYMHQALHLTSCKLMIPVN